MFQSVSNRCFGNAHFSGPCRSALSLSKAGNVYGSSGILGLLKAILPLAVLWAIWPVVVYSAYGVSGSGPLSHVSKEVNEAILPEPTLAHFYTPSSVSVEILVIGISAPTQDSKIGMILRSSSSRFGSAVPMGYMGISLPFLEVASTRCGPSADQFVYCNRTRFSAVTLAKPLGLLAGTFYSNRNQSSETLAGNIFSFHNAVVETRRFKVKPDEAQQREGFFSGIPYPATAI